MPVPERVSSVLFDIIKQDGLLHDLPALEEINRRIEFYKDQFIKYQGEGELSVTRGYYDIVDEEVEKNRPEEHSCRRGCSFCCKQNVNISAWEAITIADYCKKNNIRISRKYLKEQLKSSEKELWMSRNAACVFLKNGECSIYKVRPVECRKMYVTSEPERCNIQKYPPPNGVWVARFIDVEIIITAMDMVVNETGRMAKMLMPYAH